MRENGEDPNVTKSLAHVNVLGIGISAISMGRAVELAEVLLRSGGKGYICITGVHGIMEAQKDAKLKQILNDSYLTTPDGMPTVWIGRYQGYEIERVYGPDFMIEFCTRTMARGYRHFLYGGKPGVAEHLKHNLESMIPGLQIAGWYTPPFRQLSPHEKLELRHAVRDANADVFWVGLSTPKQEHFMADYLNELDVQLMVGVGAAFDIHTGSIKDAPQWIKNSGLQWLHRLVQDYHRLWKRYLINNPLFVWKVILQITGLKSYSINK